MPKAAQRQRTSAAGFSLVETMVGILVLTIGLLAVNRLQITAMRDNSTSQRRIAAVSLAEHKLEELKNTPYVNIQAEASTPVTFANAQFTRQVTVTDNSPMANTKTVGVTVSWQSGIRSYTVPLSTIISQ